MVLTHLLVDEAPMLMVILKTIAGPENYLAIKVHLPGEQVVDQVSYPIKREKVVYTVPTGKVLLVCVNPDSWFKPYSDSYSELGENAYAYVEREFKELKLAVERVKVTYL